VAAEEAAGWWAGLGLLGRHNAVNAAVAAAALAEAGVEGATDEAALADAARGFVGLDSRLRRVATVGSVEFFDDSLSTNVLPTVAAVDAFAGRRVAVLLGGFDRGIDYRPLGEYLSGRPAPTLALTLPASGDRIAKVLDATPGPTLEVVRCGDLDEAVALAFTWCRPDGVVLLSPAAPSFGQYRDYRERAAAFAAAAARCVDA
jgi:UDP-N-acetylmuramoylalanine--D-glutamate ligase